MMDSQADPRVVLVPGDVKERYLMAPWAAVIAAALAGDDGLSVLEGVNPNDRTGSLNALWARKTIGCVMLREAPWHLGMTALLHDRSSEVPASVPAAVAEAATSLLEIAEQEAGS